MLTICVIAVNEYNRQSIADYSELERNVGHVATTRRFAMNPFYAKM